MNELANELLMMVVRQTKAMKAAGLLWNGQDGVCAMCGKLVSEHDDWVLPDRVVKYCAGWKAEAIKTVKATIKKKQAAGDTISVWPAVN